MPLRFATLITLCFVFTPIASAGVTTGRLRLDASAPSLDEPVGYWNVWNGFVPPAEERVSLERELTVVLRGAEVSEVQGCSYRLFGGDLMPRTLVAKSGTEIRLENRDAMSHELEFEGLEGSVTTATAPGNSRPITAGTGTYAIRDLAFSHVEGHLVAIDDLVACAQVTSDGTFAFPELPAGDYQLVIYRRGEAIHDAAVTVADDETTLEPISLN